jgi:hypothetical protein
MSDSAEWLRNLARNYADSVLGMTPEDHHAWDIADEIEHLRIENWQLKGALGYEVPGHIPCGDFKCGLCEAKDDEIERLRAGRDEAHREIAKLMIAIEQLRIALHKGE